uniref:Uncharacterized protein n=1 Tax=Avena sativa TaxID=4498 RepID=A0ACD5WLU1_AVESA
MSSLPLPAKATVAKSAGGGSTHGSRLPEEIFVWEILARLPHRDLIRCRAVSHAWRRAASARDLLLEHHHRQPSLPLINRRGTPGGPRWFNVAALDCQQVQPVARLDGFHVCVKASCDGLLLLAEGLHGSPFGMRVSICNPATRQIGHLPQLKGYVALGLYRHRSTGEYRLLLRWAFNRRAMYIFALDHHQVPPRRVECPPEALRYQLSSSAPVMLHGNLHWAWYTVSLPRQSESKNILVFDTTAESFRQMCSPDVAIYRADLFEMDGNLGMYTWDNGMRVVRIWVMQDYENQVWSLKCSVELPVPEIPPLIQERRSLMVVYQEGDVRLLVACGGLLLCVDTQGNLLASSRDDGHRLSISKQFLKKSLVSHAFFSTLQGDINAWSFI